MVSKATLRQLIEDRIFSLEGTEFQRMCDRLREKMYPDDSQSTRAAGKKGDGKNDGYSPKAGIYFACFATRGVTEAKIKEKIESDLSGFLEKKWKGAKKWVFATNDILGGGIPQFIEGLKTQHTNIEIEPWNKDRLTSEIMKLNDEQVIADVLGMGIDELSTTTTQQNHMNIASIHAAQVTINNGSGDFAEDARQEAAELDAINEIFEEITKKVKDGATRELDDEDQSRHLKTQRKIALNFTSQEDKECVEKIALWAMRLVRSIEERMQIETPEMQDAITAYIFTKYDTLKRQGLSNYSILTKLFEELMPSNRNVMLNAVRAFVMFFFEDCTIFEKEPREASDTLPLK